MTSQARTPHDQRFAGHLLQDEAAPGPWNMAVDEALLEHASADNGAVWLRFYHWSEPTLSLGYFQPSAMWREHVTQDCAVVRRPTGGGAILHDRELTYSLVLPPRHSGARSMEALYGIVHSGLIRVLDGLGISARLHGRDKMPPTGGEEPFMCFQRRSTADVVVPLATGGGSSEDQEKICGSAQRRRNGALLMHGSLLLAASAFSPQIFGLKEFTGRSPNRKGLQLAWADSVRPALLLESWQEMALPEAIRRHAESLDRCKYSSSSWTDKR